MICIYCAQELGLNQQYYHRCKSMKDAGADSPLAMTEVKVNHLRVNNDLAEIIVSEKVGTRVEVLGVNQYYNTDLLYQVKYRVSGEDKVQETTISEMDILKVKRS